MTASSVTTGCGRIVVAAAAAVATTATTAVFGVLDAEPAAAHVGGGGTSPTNYRAEVSAVRPATPKVAVTVGVGGQWLRVSSRGAEEVVVLGYRGEPFLRLARHRVEVNRSSVTAERTGQLAGSQPPPDPGAGPRWGELDEGDSVAWPDARIAGGPPPSGTQGVTDTSRLRRWAVPLSVDGQRVTVTGTRVRVEPPPLWPWLALLGLCAAGVAAIGWLRGRSRPLPTLGALAAAAGAAYVAHVAGATAVPQPTGRWGVWVSAGGTAAIGAVLTGYAAIAAWRRRESAPFIIAMAGGVLVVLTGSDAAVFWNSQLAFAGPAWLERVLVAATVGPALGLVIAGINLIRRQPVPAADHGEEGTDSSCQP
ncbi:MAG: hypothetical protein GEV03_27010 [Streptosporangiales bacterium]|nr:hypothetical protein [Streptosporangiales bacterium]